MKKKNIVIALGGNALLRGSQAGTIEEQEQNTKETLKNILYLIEEGHNIVLSHGNGPQVGNILMRNDAGFSTYNIPQMPLDICVADSQGGIGYMIERVLRNELIKANIDKDIVTLVTQTVVNKDDPAFQNPTKRVGKLYSKADAEKLTKEKQWVFKESPKADDAWRRVVASPRPIDIFNLKTIKNICEQGSIVIASGGGGIPVSIDENGLVQSQEAVIDKDMASSVLASRINADEFYILTDVPYVYLNYREENQQALEHLTKDEALEYMKQGKFGEGNMAPKIEACLEFIKAGGKKAVITEATKLADKTYGTKITL